MVMCFLNVNNSRKILTSAIFTMFSTTEFFVFVMSISSLELSKFPFSLPSLPFEDNALEPILSKESFDFHHKKHHNAYVVKLNELVENTEYQNLTLKEIIVKSENDE